MPTNAGNVGVDYSFTFYDGNTSSMVDMSDIQNVKITAQKHDVANRPYNAPARFDFIPDGYRISFNITRVNESLENYAVTREANFNGGIGNIAGYFNETVNNVDGTVSRYQYTGFVFFLTDHGDISREKIVTLSGEGMASQKVQIA